MYHSESTLEFNPEAANFEEEIFEFGQHELAPATSEVFSEEELMELTAELLSISSEAELDQFLGKMFKGIWRGIKKVARPLGGILKGIAKTALPFVGKALGSFIPIPGVGTALGGALGGALSKALEAEFQDMETEERDFEIARRFVQLAGTAAKQAALAAPNADPVQVAKSAITHAARLHVPSLGVTFPASAVAAAARGQASTGRWIRRGRNIIVVNS